MSLSYSHTQSSGSNTWTINHNLNCDSVVVDVYISEGGSMVKVLPLDVQETSSNTITILFTSSESGFARIVC